MDTTATLKKSKKPVIIVGLIILLVITALYMLVTRVVLFAVSSSYPRNGGVLANSSQQLVINFNKPLAQQTIKAHIDSEELRYKIENKKLTLRRKPGAPEQFSNGPHKLTIAEVTAKNGQKITNLVISFSVAYQDFNQLPKAERERQIEESSGFDGSNPIAKKLPITENGYTLSYLPPDIRAGEQSKPILDLSVTFAARGLSDEGENPYTQAVRAARKAALAKIESMGFKPSDYIFQLGEPTVLANEFLTYRPGLLMADDYGGDGIPPEQHEQHTH